LARRYQNAEANVGEPRWRRERPLGDREKGRRSRKERERRKRGRERARVRKRGWEGGWVEEDEQEGPLGIVRGRSLVTRDSCDPDDP